MGDSNRTDNSIAVNLLSSVIEMAAGEEPANDLRAGAERLIPPGFDGEDLDAAVLAGSIGGLRLSQASRLAEAAHIPEEQEQQEQHAQGQTPVTAREIHHPNGAIHSMRVFVAAEEAEFDLNDDGVVVTVGQQKYPIPTPFTPHEVHIEDMSDGIIEAVVDTPPMIEGDE